MSHIHIPDCVLPLWLIVTGWLLAIGLSAFAARRAADLDLRRRVPLVGALAAMMLLGMSTEIIPIAYHINLTVVAGIVLGPWLSIIAALVVCVMLALVGHGGLTVIGLNTMVIVVEMIGGWALFHGFVRLFGRRRAALSAGAATVIALALSTTLLIGIVAIGGSPAASRESGALDPTTLSFDNPFAEGVATNVLVAGEAEEDLPQLSIRRFAVMVYGLGLLGWILEALISAAIIGFIARVRPSLVFEGALGSERHAPLGDEGVHR